MKGVPTTTGRVEEAASLLLGFARRTGIDSGRPGKRYLWTDAFAVCAFLHLAEATGEEPYSRLAVELIDRVHRSLGRYRDDDSRKGWLSGLDEETGREHPTLGGLRIGKELPERAAGEPFSEFLEWERDGQYFHYLTKWTHALDQASRALSEPRYNLWARELARTAHDAFVCRSTGPRTPRMVWKMSTDLSRPLVPSMGQHDPLEGTIACVQLEMTASLLIGNMAGPRLGDAVSDFAVMAEEQDIATADPLGLGGLLSDAYRIAQLLELGARYPGVDLMDRLLAAALEGLSQYSRSGELRQPASRRLAFRELGLAIGLSALERLREEVEDGRQGAVAGKALRARLDAIASFSAVRTSIQSFWLEAEHRAMGTWAEHRDINEVMLATALVPEGFLVLSPPVRRGE